MTRIADGSCAWSLLCRSARRRREYSDPVRYAESLRLEEPEIRVSSIYPSRVATDMQVEDRALEQADYRAADYLRASTVADLIITVLMLPADGVIIDLSLRPRHPPSTR